MNDSIAELRLLIQEIKDDPSLLDYSDVWEALSELAEVCLETLGRYGKRPSLTIVRDDE